MFYNIEKHGLNTARPGKKNLNLIREYFYTILCLILYNYFLFYSKYINVFRALYYIQIQNIKRMD